MRPDPYGLDPLQDLFGVRRDPDLFLNTFAPPLILDEVQYVPESLPALKRRIDQSDSPGQYFLTGSQNPSVLRSVSEGFAGRECFPVDKYTTAVPWNAVGCL